MADVLELQTVRVGSRKSQVLINSYVVNGYDDTIVFRAVVTSVLVKFYLVGPHPNAPCSRIVNRNVSRETVGNR